MNKTIDTGKKIEPALLTYIADATHGILHDRVFQFILLAIIILGVVDKPQLVPGLLFTVGSLW